MVLLPLISALYVSVATPHPGDELLNADDQSLLRAMEDKPAIVVAHIRAQQRRIEWLERELQQVTPRSEASMEQSTSQGRQLSSAKPELNRDRTGLGKRAIRTLRAEASSDGCSDCRAAASCYSHHACQGGKMHTNGPFAQCARVPRVICDMYAHVKKIFRMGMDMCTHDVFSSVACCMCMHACACVPV